MSSLGGHPYLALISGWLIARTLHDLVNWEAFMESLARCAREREAQA